MTALIESDPWGPSSSVTPDLLGGLTEADLIAQALASDPDRPADPDAVPFGEHLASSAGLLPSWYMPAPMGGRRRGWRQVAVVVVIVSFLVINALGLCITYGHLVPA
jgi:hypothetical protein